MTEKEINKLVSDNINYVKSVANHYRGNGVDFDDLVSEGTLAMLTAAQKYDAERGSQFVAYASPFIRKAMQQTIDKQAALYRVPKDQKKHAPRNAAKAVSIDAPISEGNKYTLLDILINKDAQPADDRPRLGIRNSRRTRSVPRDSICCRIALRWPRPVMTAP